MAPLSIQTHVVSPREKIIGEVRQLREVVDRLAAEMSHLGREVHTLRREVGTLDLGLECFSSERPRSDRPRSVPGALRGERPHVEPVVRVTIPPPFGRAEPEGTASRKTVVRASVAAGLTALLLVVALPRIGDRSVSVDTLAAHGEWLQPLRGAALVDVPRRFFFSQARARPTSYGDSLSRLSVARSGIGSEVIERELLGRSGTFGVGAAVTFWTHVVGGRRGDTIRHVWFHDGREVVAIALPVGSPSWRTQSRHSLAAGSEGEWVVESRDSEGRLLARQQFQCEG